MTFIVRRRRLLQTTILAAADFTSQTLPSWLTYTRASQATMTDASGNVVYGPNNLLLNSAALSTQSVSVVANSTFILSIFGTGSVVVSGGASATLNGTGAANRVFVRLTSTTTSLTFTVSGSVTSAQLEQVTTAQTVPSAYLPTGASSAAFGPRFTWVSANSRYELLANEPTRTNGVRQNVPTSAALPPTWGIGTLTNNTVTVAGFGSEQGVAYLDLQITATAAGSGRVQFDSVTLDGVTWRTSSPVTLSGYFKVIAGDFTAFNPIALRTTFLPSATSSVISIRDVTNAALATQRRVTTGTTGASDTSARPEIFWTSTGAGTVTLRVGLVSLIPANTTYSDIPTYGSALTVSADPIQFTPGDPVTNFLLADAFTAIIEGTPAASNNGTAIDIGPTSNDSLVALGASGNTADFVMNGGTPVLSGNSYTSGQTIRMGITRDATGKGSVCLNGGTVVNGGPVTPVTRTNAYLGSNQGTSSFWGGTMAKAAILTPISDAFLQAKSAVGASI